MADPRNGDDVQRARLARLLSDPVGYFADARRHAHEQAKRLLEARLHEHQPSPGRP
ncbi:MAG TPA: hypothetical protein VKZ81_27815 [Pseudonocardia sp.]|uniref:hypothetical protein n=1 Tax=Pseudonocardia sp. TaxID=60912 RepID=UPI002B4B8896|nr:hypothetical protein [Pseudonocardia sp.]HLU59287.1 hypothetical protein [Pseudonocardia sp.]